VTVFLFALLSDTSCSLVVTDVGFGAPATGAGLFGQQQQQQQQSTGTSLFGNTAFGAAKPMFGAAATTASAPFGGLSTAGAGTTLFGQANQNKVFSATLTASVCLSMVTNYFFHVWLNRIVLKICLLFNNGYDYG